MTGNPDQTDHGARSSDRPLRKPRVELWVSAILLEALLLESIYINIKMGYDTHLSVGSYIVAGLVFQFFFTGILPMAWWAAFRFNRKKAAGPIVTWAALTALVGILAIGGAMNNVPEDDEITASLTPPSRDPAKVEYSHAFRPPGCELSAGFPAEPEMKQYRSALAFRLEEAEVAFRGSLLRAGCVVAAKDTIRDRTQLTEYIVEFARQNGLADIDHSYSDEGAFIEVQARGRKQESGRGVTYEYRWYVGTNSTLTLTTRGDSAGYPQQEITEFIAAVGR